MMLIKKFCVLLLCLITLLSISACSTASKEVELFNTQTEETITLYEKTLEVAKDTEQDLVMGIFTGDITLPCSSTLDYSEAHQLMVDHTNTQIEELAVVNSTNFYTRLGVNSVTQITDFHFQGTRYILQVLWVDCKIDMLILEVKDYVG